jgi:hypothetical protein
MTRRNTLRHDPQRSAQRLLPDVEAAPLLGLSTSFLRKDRRAEAPSIPAVRVGDRWLYDIDFIRDRLRQRAIGGAGE